MKPTFDHKLQTSFILWFDHELLTRGEAYKNMSSILYPYGTYDGHFIYSSPYSQWVNDSSISGAFIPSGVSVNGTFIPRGVSGLKIDYQNGRALFPISTGNVNNFTNVSGSFALKDFNVYYTVEEESDVLFESKYHPRPKYSETPTGINTKATYPGVWIKFNPNENEPFAFGGLDETNANFRAVVLSDNVYLLDGILSIFRDTNNRVFPVFSIAELPFTQFGDLKSGNYNWNNLIQGKEGDTLCHIKKVRTLKFSERVNTQVSDSTFGAVIDFETMYVRQPRNY